MKKIIIVNVIAIISTLLLTMPALAKNGPHIGPGMPQDTEACAGCHRGHTGTQAKLLASGSDVYSFCATCHDGTGANTNVLDGWFGGQGAANPATPNSNPATAKGYNTEGDGQLGAGLNGGGFLNAMAYDGRSGRTTGWGSITSRHNLVGLDGAGPWTPWGGGPSGNGPGEPQIALECTSCHDPHGSENYDGSERYRIFRNKINDETFSLYVTSHEPDGGAKDYTKDQYRSDMSKMCLACHTQYVSKKSTYDAGDGKGTVPRHRHTVDQSMSLGDATTGNGQTIASNLNDAGGTLGSVRVPAEQSSGYNANNLGSDTVVCLTCHQAHGTNATMNSPSVDLTPPPANSSTLLRLNQRRVCQNCHQK